LACRHSFRLGPTTTNRPCRAAGETWVKKAIQPVLMGVLRRQRMLTVPDGMDSALNRPSVSASTVITPALCLMSTTADWRGIS
jgi:hypothetical protein